MPGCVDDVVIVTVVGGVGAHQHGRAQESSRRKKLGLVNRLANDNRLGISFGGNVAFTQSASSHLPPGADSNAVAALRDVDQYSSAYTPPLRLALPSPNQCLPAMQVGPFRIGGGASGSRSMKDEAEPLVCEELKRWLLLAASGAASVQEVSDRLEFYRQLLMEPEILSDTSFRQTMARVCQHLDALVERRSGALRTCASQMGLLQEAGRDLLNALMPVLLFAIVDAFDAQRFPHITAERLLTSATRSLDAAAGPLATGQSPSAGAPDDFACLWGADAGRLLRGLLLSPHFHEFCGGGEASATKLPDVETFANLQVELYHGWMDRVDGGMSLDGSGLQVRFQKNKEMHQKYIDLCKDVDNYVKFLSFVGHFKRLANIDGDAGMFSMMDNLRHLLQEIDTSAMKMAQSAANIMEDVKNEVTNLVLSKQSGGHARWIERLTMIDELEQQRHLTSLLALAQDLRHRISEARLPALRSSARRNLEQILSTFASEGFRLRSSEEPPALTEGGPHSLQAGALAFQDDAHAPAWSVELHFRFQASEVPGGKQDQLRRMVELHEADEAPDLSPSARLGSTVERLNTGAIQDPEGPFYIYRDSEDGSYVALHRPGDRERAVDALGINSLPEPRQEAEPRGDEPPGGALPADEPAPAAGGAAAAPSEEVPSMPGSASEAAAAEAPPAVAAPGGEVEAKEALPELVQVSPEEEETYYSVLLHNPGLHEDSGCITGDAALQVLRRSECDPPVPDKDLMRILADEGFSERASVSVEGLRRLGRRLARAQGAEGGADGGQRFLPRLRGLTWNASRKRVNVLEPFD